jgi:hypothetical protein
VVFGLLIAPAAASAEQVTLAWDPSPDASVTGYVVYFGTASGVYSSSVDVLNQTRHIFESLTDGVTYYFVVRAYNAAGDFSPASNEARLVGSFSDHPLTAGVHVMRTVHITELRSRIDALRTGRGLPAASWTGTLSSGMTVIRAAHLAELRTALNAVYLAVGQTPPTYIDSVLTAGWTAIKAAHITELRAAVVALE